MELSSVKIVPKCGKCHTFQ